MARRIARSTCAGDGEAPRSRLVHRSRSFMHRRRPVHLLVAAAVVLPLSVLARDLPDFHIQAQTRPLGRIELPSRLGVPGQVASRDERTGMPTFIWADPSHTSSAVSSALATHAPVEAVARAHLGDYAAHFGLDAAALQGLEVREVHDTGTGA